MHEAGEAAGVMVYVVAGARVRDCSSDTPDIPYNLLDQYSCCC